MSSKKILIGGSVLEAAKKRIAWLFDEFEEVVVSVSRGKDSTVVFELSYAEAQKRGKTLKCLFLDQEAEWDATIAEIRKIRDRKGIEMLWYQAGFKINNASSYDQDWLYLWEKGKEDVWIRPYEEGSIRTDFGDVEWYDMFPLVTKEQFGNQKMCYIGGVRTEESPQRARSLTQSETYKGRTWGKKLDERHEQFTFYPIYDWSYSDVWKAIHDHGWHYNPVYDWMYQYGISVMDMRVSSLFHESSVRALFFMQEFEKDNYNRLVKRLQGVDTAGKMSYDHFYCPKELPFMFVSWSEYRDHLLENLIQDEGHKEGFRKKFEEMEPLYGPYLGDKLHRKQINSIMTNDFGFWKLDRMVIPREQYDEFKVHRANIAKAKKENKNDSRI